MKTWVKVVILTVVITIVAFLATPNGPLGAFWGADPHGPQPSSEQVPGFMILGLLESLFLGLGISFLVFGLPVVREIAGGATGLARATHLSISWIMLQWWAHDNLHLVAGMDFGKILAIDYGFHVTMMLATVILVYFLITVSRERTAARRGLIEYEQGLASPSARVEG